MILALSPLPEDAEEQIDELYEATASEEEKELFTVIYEGLEAAMNRNSWEKSAN